MRLPARVRITAAFTLAIASVLAALTVFVYLRTGADLRSAADAGLRSRADVLTAQVARDGPDVPGAPANLIESDEAFAQIADRGGRVLHTSRIVEGEALVPASVAATISAPRFLDRRLPKIDDVTRVLAVPVRYDGRTYVVAVGTSLQDRRDALVELAATLAVAGAVALALISFGGWLVIGAVLRPVERMRAEAAAISALEPARRLAVPPGDDEFANLARTLNEMLDRLEEAFERERRFVDDASHELRTPIAILRARLETALAHPRGAEVLERTLRRALEDSEHLSRLAADLLVLSRAEGGRVPIHRERTALADLVDSSTAAERARAATAGIDLEVVADDRTVMIDPDRARQVLANVLDNAIRHTPPGGRIRLAASAVGDGVRITVDDSGDGFPATFLDTAFEPFSQGDGDAGGGAGLGLAIVRAVAEAHGGRASVENRREGGARVTVELPGRG